MPPSNSVKTLKGLQELDKLLADRSYIANGPHATKEDMEQLEQLGLVAPDKQALPHVSRWYWHMRSLRATYADYYVWPSTTGGSAGSAASPPQVAAQAASVKKGPRAAGKEQKQHTVDCQPIPVTDKRVPSSNPQPLGAGAVNINSKGPKFYVSTAINYTNGWPHMGHAYEALVADAFARLSRLMGNDTFYMTGSDEHGQKIAQAAEGEGVKPIEICDRYVNGFQALNQRLCISNDKYVRTTSAEHKKVVQEIWKKCKDAGDIYFDVYEGWYLVREERFVTDTEAKEWDFKDPGSGTPLKKMSEPSFFFRLSKYQKKVLEFINQDNGAFIQPEQYRKEIVEWLSSDELRDLSISRGTFDHGIPCPEEPVNGQKHVMYVWFDALSNYFSGVDGLDPSKPLHHYWPADWHIIGKDIIRFHCVYWPAFLMSAGLPLPKHVVVHGFISGPDGRKMSKSYGNVVDPHVELDQLSCDSFRWYLCREAEFGFDLKYSQNSLRMMHNADLCDKLGNLVHRAVNLCGGTIPDCDPSLVSLPFNLAELKKNVLNAFSSYKLAEVAGYTIVACGATNKWIADLEPWKMKTEDKLPTRQACCRLLLEAVYVLAHFFAPFTPNAAEAIFKKLGTEPKQIPDLADGFMNLKAGGAVTTGSILFEQLEVEGATAAIAPKAKAKAEAKAKGEVKGKADTKGKADAKGKTEPQDDPDQPLFSKLDVRVGRIVTAKNHPNADRLFIEEIDVGDPEGPRQIVSGLREHYKLEDLQDRKILVVCNMKPSMLVKVESSGMVLCAKSADKKVVELITVPNDCEVGQRVLPEDIPHGKWSPVKPEVLKKKKIWEGSAEKLQTNKVKEANFDGSVLVTERGTRFTAPTQVDSPIS